MALFRHLLLLTVGFGLAGQGVARASAPCQAIIKAQASLMAGKSDCGAARDAGKGKAPCNDMKVGCVAMTGFSAAFGIDTHANVAGSPVPMVMAATWPAMPKLIGRDIAPDPDPPSLLG